MKTRTGTKMRYFVCFILLLCVFISSCSNTEQKSKEKKVKIAIFQIVDFELINNMRNVFISEIEKSNYGKTHQVEFLPHKDGHNDINLINQISDQLIGENPDLIYVLGTPVAQALIQRTSTIPIVQGGVTDPVSAKLANDWEGSGRNYAASTDFPPVEAQFKVLSEQLPGVKNIGTVFNSGESNTVALMNRVRPVVEKMGLNLVERSVTSTSEVSAAVTSLIGKIDVIYVPTDNTVVAAMPTLLEIAGENKIPVMANTKEDVQKGALFSLGVSYDELSVLAAEISIRILEGEKPANIPIATAKNPYLYWNYGTSKKLGIEPNNSVKEKVNIWYENMKEIVKPY